MGDISLKAIRINLNLSAEEMSKKVGYENAQQWYRRENYEVPIEAWAIKEVIKLSGVPIDQIKLK